MKDHTPLYLIFASKSKFSMLLYYSSPNKGIYDETDKTTADTPRRATLAKG